MFKIKHVRTADCVLAGFRWHKTSTEDAAAGRLAAARASTTPRHSCSTSAWSARSPPSAAPSSSPSSSRCCSATATSTRGREWADAQAHQGQRLPGNVSRWNATKDLSFVPLRPERVLEVKYEHMEGTRFRHLAHFLRWRDDRTPESCTYEQLEQPVTFSLDDIVPGLGG